MRSWWLAAKIAAVFMLVMLVFVSVTLHQFMNTVVRAGIHGGMSPGDAHHEFVTMVLRYGVLAMIAIVLLAFFVTRPLRRMRRSMDRVAAGDLDHRVPARGLDEVAAMGRSFNTMAERVQGMIVGQKELMAGVSHELRSPLARLKLGLELLRDGRGGAERVDGLVEDVDTLDSLVEELLLASRVELGSVPLAIEPLELDTLCREAWTRVAAEAARQGMTLEIRLADDAKRVRAHRVLVVRLLGNLFENAVRHAGSGEITVDSVRRGDRVEITVADNGPGVDDADLERLFEPFFRTERSRPHGRGTGGLGLMIVRRAVEAHHGTIRARAAAPSGLTISFDLLAVEDPGDRTPPTVSPRLDTDR